MIKRHLIITGILLLVLIALNMRMAWGSHNGWFNLITSLLNVSFVLYLLVKTMAWLHKRYRRRFWIGLFTGMALGIFGICFAFKAYETKFYLEHLPQEMGISKIIYMENEAWGYGPGGNETGVIAYALPPNSARAIKSGGIDYFSALSFEDTPRNKYMRMCGSWRETPLLNDADARWKLESFLDRQGFGIPIDADIREQIDLAVSKKGSFYTYCRGSIIVIVVPEMQKAFMVYAG